MEVKPAVVIGATLAVIAIIALQAWFMTIVFSWFNLQITIWQSLGIILLLKSILASVNDK